MLDRDNDVYNLLKKALINKKRIEKQKKKKEQLKTEEEEVEIKQKVDYIYFSLKTEMNQLIEKGEIEFNFSRNIVILDELYRSFTKGKRIFDKLVNNFRNDGFYVRSYFDKSGYYNNYFKITFVVYLVHPDYEVHLTDDNEVVILRNVEIKY